MMMNEPFKGFVWPNLMRQLMLVLRLVMMMTWSPSPSSSPSSPTSTSTSTTTLSTTSCYKLFSVMVSSSLPMPSLLPSSPTSTSTPPTTSHLHHHLLLAIALGHQADCKKCNKCWPNFKLLYLGFWTSYRGFKKKGNSSKFNGQDDWHFILCPALKE